MQARLLVVVQELRVRHVDCLLGVVFVDDLWRRGQLVGDDVVDVIGSSRAAEAHELDLYGARPQREDIGSVALRPPVQIEKYVNALGVDEAGQLEGEKALLYLVELVARGLDVLPAEALVVGPETEADDLKVLPVVQPEERVEQVGQGMVGEVIRNVAYPEPPWLTLTHGTELILGLSVELLQRNVGLPHLLYRQFSLALRPPLGNDELVLHREVEHEKRERLDARHLSIPELPSHQARRSFLFQ